MCVKTMSCAVRRAVLRTSFIVLHLEDMGFQVYQNKKECFLCPHLPQSRPDVYKRQAIKRMILYK